MIVSYHDSDSYSDIKFCNGSWSCSVKYKTREVRNHFNPNQWPNNRMQADDSEIIDRLRSARISDEIHFKGFLANYGRVNCPLFRKSGTTRTDQGNHACETVYIDEFTIVRSANKSWRFLYNSGRILLFISLISAFILAWFTPVKIRLRDN